MYIKRPVIRKTVILTAIFFFFLLLSSVPSQVYAASDPRVIQIAKKHTLRSAKIVEAGSSRRKLVCVLNGKRLKKKNYWFCVDGSVYYNNKKAVIQTGSFTYKGFRYYAGRKDGKLKINSFHNSGSDLYYFGSTGALITDGWHTADGHKRYFDSNGKICLNQWIGDQYVGYDGVVISSLKHRWEPWNPAADENGRVIFVPNASEKHLIIIGASRVVYMSWDVPRDSRITYIASPGKGIDWLKNEAMQLLDFWLSIYPGSKVVIQLGNNGIHSEENSWLEYRSAYNYLLRHYPRTSFYFMDVLPGNLDYNVKNEDRIEFNDHLRRTFPKQWIGGYDYLIEKGFETIDKIHYDKATNRMLYSYILREAGW